MRALNDRTHQVVGAARSGADVTLDITDIHALDAALATLNPQGVINCAAMVDLPTCEANPLLAYGVNARPLTVLAAWSQRTARPLVHISTDQMFVLNDGRAAHDEDAPVQLIHEYARSKFAGEAFALTASNALVVRTNMAASQPGRGKTSIAAWALDVFARRAPLTLFTDYYCSTIDADALAEAVLELVDVGVRGRINVAAREVFSKAEFLRALAAAAGVDLDWADEGSAEGLSPRRAVHVGLDVARAEAALGRRLPSLAQVASTLVRAARGEAVI